VSRFVLDASTVLTWCFPDEKAQKAEEVSERIVGDTVIVPAFWRHEIVNGLPVDVDAGATDEVVFSTTQALCRKHSLTAYDAAYL
jgi:predicted nucleic acid-binding protein